MSVTSDTKASKLADVSCFVVYQEGETCNENSLFAALHNEDMEPDITPIRVRSNAQTNEDSELAARKKRHTIGDVDEWSASSTESNLVKCICQDG